MKNSGWVVIVFEDEFRQFDGEVAYVKGPFAKYEEAEVWSNNTKDCLDGQCQITFIEPAME